MRTTEIRRQRCESDRKLTLQAGQQRDDVRYLCRAASGQATWRRWHGAPQPPARVCRRTAARKTRRATRRRWPRSTSRQRLFRNTAAPSPISIRATTSFKITGSQVNKGLEVSAVGESFNGLTVYGGVTLSNARHDDTGLASTDDKTFTSARQRSRANSRLFEYQIPGIQGLVAIFDWQFTGPRPGIRHQIRFKVAGYNLFDLGARYPRPICDSPRMSPGA